MQSEYRRKSALALGIAIIALMFLLETAVADQRLPNAASPLIWAVLGTVAVLGFVAFGWFRLKAKNAAD